MSSGEASQAKLGPNSAAFGFNIRPKAATDEAQCVAERARRRKGPNFGDCHYCSHDCWFFVVFRPGDWRKSTEAPKASKGSEASEAPKAADAAKDELNWTRELDRRAYNSSRLLELYL